MSALNSLSLSLAREEESSQSANQSQDLTTEKEIKENAYFEEDNMKNSRSASPMVGGGQGGGGEAPAAAVIKDPWCDLDNPRVVKFEEISAAAYRIRDGVVRTPCDVSAS